MWAVRLTLFLNASLWWTGELLMDGFTVAGTDSSTPWPWVQEKQWMDGTLTFQAPLPHHTTTRSHHRRKACEENLQSSMSVSEVVQRITKRDFVGDAAKSGNNQWPWRGKTSFLFSVDLIDRQENGEDQNQSSRETSGQQERWVGRSRGTHSTQSPQQRKL